MDNRKYLKRKQLEYARRCMEDYYRLEGNEKVTISYNVNTDLYRVSITDTDGDNYYYDVDNDYHIKVHKAILKALGITWQEGK